MGFCVQHTVEPPLTPTSPQRPLFFVPADSPYIGSYLNLSTTATVTAARPQLPNSSLDNGQFYQRLTKFEPYGALMSNRGNRILIVSHL